MMSEKKYTLDEITNACLMAEVSDGQYESISLALMENAAVAESQPGVPTSSYDFEDQLDRLITAVSNASHKCGAHNIDEDEESYDSLLNVAYAAEEKLRQFVRAVSRAALSAPVAPVQAASEGWISVDERLPQEKMRALIAYESDADGVPCLDVGYGRLDNDGWKHAATFYHLGNAAKGRPFEMREAKTPRVHYWMPLPAAPATSDKAEGV